MGQCVSQKAVSAFQRPVAAHHHRKKAMEKNNHIKRNSDYDSSTTRKTNTHTRGVATSFGFRRRPVTAPAIANNVTAAKRLAKQEIIDRNGNSGDTESLTSNAIPPGRTTPKLAPPKKEASATKVNRFGFRQPNSNRLNKISDINSQLEIRNNNRSAPQLRFTLQSSQLPAPQVPAVKLFDSKTAKTLANTCKRASSRMYLCENNSNSSKDGSFTEDSGVGSHTSSGMGENDTLHSVELTDTSPTLHKARRFDVVLSGLNFDLRDLDETSEPFVPLPSLPSAFQHNTGLVQNRRFEYEKQVQRRKISGSTDGFSDDYCNIDNAPKKFLKTHNNREISPYSSDQDSWNQGGEAMADDTSYSCSSSDDISSTPALALQNFMNASITNKTAPLHEIRNVLLTIEDPKFAAVANKFSGCLLDDETSPVDSLICSYSESEDLTKHCKLDNDNIMNIEKSLSNSKDINEKDGSSSPGTPTNATNSLSLSDGKDYFDDEIADQPALVFDDTITTTEQPSENTPTLMDITPKPKPKFFGSPLLLRKRNLLLSTASVDTLSPCESIASDDLMMDFDHSQSSGLDDTLERNDTHQNSLGTLEDTTLKPADHRMIDSVWAVCVGNSLNSGSPISSVRPSRLLRSRGSTSSGSKPDSPCSLDSQISSRNCHSLTRSPLRLARPAINSHSGYDSDDSIKLDRTNHSAMIQDVVQIKTMLIKLRRVINEQADEDHLKKSDTLNPFDNQQSLKNGIFNGLSSGSTTSLEDDSRIEMAELRRQVLFLQGQLEDREQSLRNLHETMEKLVLDTETAKSAPASTVSSEISSVNAATQTERIRPISAGPSLLQVSPTDGSMGSLVSVSERKSRSSSSSSYKQNQPSLWRKPGEPPSRHISYGTSNTSSVNIPKRAKSRTRAPLTPV